MTDQYIFWSRSLTYNRLRCLIPVHLWYWCSVGPLGNGIQDFKKHFYVYMHFDLLRLRMNISLAMTKQEIVYKMLVV